MQKAALFRLVKLFLNFQIPGVFNTHVLQVVYRNLNHMLTTSNCWELKLKPVQQKLLKQDSDLHDSHHRTHNVLGATTVGVVWTASKRICKVLSFSNSGMLKRATYFLMINLK